MKKLFLIILFFNHLYSQPVTHPLSLEKIVFDQLSLTHNLVNFSLTLTSSNAVDYYYIESLLSNINSNVLNARNLLSEDTSNSNIKDSLSSFSFKLEQCISFASLYSKDRVSSNRNKLVDCLSSTKKILSNIEISLHQSDKQKNEEDPTS